jgi:hypothetical protein
MCRHDPASLFVLFCLLHVELTVFDTGTINSYTVSLLRKVKRCSPVLRGKLPLAEHFGLFGEVNLFLLACHPRTRQTKVLLMPEPLSSTTSFAPRILSAQTERSWLDADQQANHHLHLAWCEHFTLRSWFIALHFVIVVLGVRA